MGRDPDASGSTLRWVAALDNSQNDLHKWFFRTKKGFAKWHSLVWFPWWTGSIEGNEERVCSKNISGLNPNGHFWKSVVGLSSLCFARFVSVSYQPSMYICIFPRGPKKLCRKHLHLIKYQERATLTLWSCQQKTCWIWWFGNDNEGSTKYGGLKRALHHTQASLIWAVSSTEFVFWAFLDRQAHQISFPPQLNLKG